MKNKGEQPLLLQFLVKNFRSFQKEEALDLSASAGSELLESNTFEFAKKQRLVRSAVIYGPNAGGKSNLIKAIHFLQQFVLLSSTNFQEGQKIAYSNASGVCFQNHRGTDSKNIGGTFPTVSGDPLQLILFS